MKPVLYLSILLFSKIVLCQNLENDLRLNICDCFEKAAMDGDSNIELLNNCFDFFNEENKSIIEKIILKEVDTTNIENRNSYQEGYDFGQKLLYDLQRPLIQDCKAYFEFIEKMKRFMVSNLDKGFKEEDIDLLRMEFEKENYSPDKVWLVGAYELYIGEFDKAIEFLKLCVARDSTHLPSNLFLALSYDFKKDYDTAIKNTVMYRKYLIIR